MLRENGFDRKTVVKELMLKRDGTMQCKNDLCDEIAKKGLQLQQWNKNSKNNGT